MKRIIQFCFSLCISFVHAQVTTSPVIPTISDVITITLDTSGTGLDGYTGDVYAHTGVITTASISQSDWKHVIGSWGNNATQPKLTSIGGGIYQLVITPDLATYYSVGGGEVVTDIAVVFRNSAGSAQTSPDIFIPIYATGLNVTFTNPSDGDLFDLNDNITISGESSIAADLEIEVNSVSAGTETDATTISKSYTFTGLGNHTLKIRATENSEIKEEEIDVYVRTTTQNASLPSGLENGFNNNGDGTVSLVLQAPSKTDVFLIGSFNDWKLNPNYQMKKDNDTFWLTLSGLDADTEYAYQYYVDYSLKVADPYSKKILDPDDDPFISSTTYPDLMAYPTGQTTGNVSTFLMNQTAYTWQTTSFSKPNKENLVIYEMLIRDFTETDSFVEAMTHLDYLQGLGINAIELMPVSEFEGNNSWGYNPSFHGALDKAYGTQNHFKEFVDECHQRGIAVILDVVYNHAFGQSPLAQLYWDNLNNKPSATNPWLNTDAKHPFNVGYDFNHESAYTKTFVKQTLKYWLEEFKIDGFRFDLSKGFTQTNNPNNVGAWGNYDASRVSILQEYGDYIWNNISSDAYLILEHFADNSEEKVLANNGFMFWGNLNHSFNQNTMGYSTDTDVSWLSYKERAWNNPHVIGYMESHDEERLMVKNIAYGNSDGGYNVKSTSTSLDRLEAATTIFYGIPGPKMIWQFGELGYDKSINCDGDIENGTCRLDRKPVAWTLGYDSDSERLDLYNVTSKMIRLKKQYPSTFNTNDFSLDVSGLVKRINLNDNVGSLDVVIMANFDVTAQSVNPNFPKTGTWYETFTGSSINVTNTNASISLQPGEYRLYSQTQSLSSKIFVSTKTLKAFPNPTNDSFSLSKNVHKMNIYSLEGKLIKSFNEGYQENYLFDISNIASSIYIVKVEDFNGKIESFKLVKL